MQKPILIKILKITNMLKIIIELIIGLVTIFAGYVAIDYIQKKLDFEELYVIIFVAFLSWQAIILGEYLLKLTY